MNVYLLKFYCTGFSRFLQTVVDSNVTPPEATKPDSFVTSTLAVGSVNWVLEVIGITSATVEGKVEVTTALV